MDTNFKTGHHKSYNQCSTTAIHLMNDDYPYVWHVMMSMASLQLLLF